MNFKRSLLAAAAGAALVLCGAASASAGTWQNNHPRRVEVNHRLGNQFHRINRDYRDGKITGAQAARLHTEDRAIRGQERFASRFDGGHITRSEQRSLNQEENGVSRQIYNQAH
jgi:hypothetical protein